MFKIGLLLVHCFRSYLDGVDHLLLAHDQCCLGLGQAFMEEQTQQNMKLFQKENMRWRQELKGLNQQALLQQDQQSPASCQASEEKQRIRELESANEHLRQELDCLKEQQRSTAPGQATVTAQDGVVGVPPQSQQHRLVRPLQCGGTKARNPCSWCILPSGFGDMFPLYDCRTSKPCPVVHAGAGYHGPGAVGWGWGQLCAAGPDQRWGWLLAVPQGGVQEAL